MGAFGSWAACRRLVLIGLVGLTACKPAGDPGPRVVPSPMALTRAAATATAVVAPAAPAGEHPAQVLDLSNWKITLPVNAEGAFSGRPFEILQPQLRAFTSAPYFQVRGDGVQFRAPVNGVTTSGSRYPRSELREMAENGTKNASWATDSGVHTMVIEQAITAVPASKRHVVAGQIHDGNDDVLVVRLEHPRLYVDHNGVDGPVLTPSYTLGTRFTVKIEASNGEIRVYYNGSAMSADTYKKVGAGNYFKAGAYTQSNCTRETVCTAENFGEVVIYRLEVSHQP
jgi:hypothetical protein